MRRGQKTSAEQVVLKLRQIEVQTAQGKSLARACKEAEISEQSYYRWRKEYGGLQVDQARKMKDLERENARLRRLVADLSSATSRCTVTSARTHKPAVETGASGACEYRSFRCANHSCLRHDWKLWLKCVHLMKSYLVIRSA